MKIHFHLFLGSIVVALYTYLTGDYKSAAIFFIASIIIDLDHIPSYWFYTKDYYNLNYNKIKYWCLSTGQEMKWFFALHNIWTAGAIYLMWQYVSTLWLSVLAGILFHYSIDISYDAYCYFVEKTNAKPCRRWII